MPEICNIRRQARKKCGFVLAAFVVAAQFICTWNIFHLYQRLNRLAPSGYAHMFLIVIALAYYALWQWELCPAVSRLFATIVRTDVLHGPEALARSDDPWEQRLVCLTNNLLQKTGREDLQVPVFICQTSQKGIAASTLVPEIVVSSSLAAFDFSEKEYEGALGHEIAHILNETTQWLDGAKFKLAYHLVLFLIGSWWFVPRSFCANALLYLATNIAAWCSAFFVYRFYQRIEEAACDRSSLLLTGHDGVAGFLERREKFCRTPAPLAAGSAALEDKLWGAHHRQRNFIERVKHLYFRLCLTHDYSGVRIARIAALSANTTGGIAESVPVKYAAAKSML
jgi:Zn-dependent protease with chaperone function